MSAYDLPVASLPPLTKAIRQTWPPGSAVSGAVQPTNAAGTMSAILDAIYSLEQRVIALGG